jgi:hypothetical protein
MTASFPICCLFIVILFNSIQFELLAASLNKLQISKQIRVWKILNRVVASFPSSSSSSSSSLALHPFMGHSLPWISWQQDFYRVGLSTPRPIPYLENQASVLVTPGYKVTQLYPKHWVPILVTFYDTHELRWDYSYPPVTTRRSKLIPPPQFSLLFI